MTNDFISMKIIRSKDMQFVPASHEDPKNPGVLKKVIVKKDDVIQGHLQMVNWSLQKTGKSIESHYHENLDEIYIILSGRGEITVDGETEIVEKGDTIIIPHGAVHTMQNQGTEDIEFIALGIAGDRDGKTVILSHSFQSQ